MKTKSNVKLNEKVKAIDYTKEPITVTTTKGVYKAWKVISTLPLGVLKVNSVRFTPELPEAYQTAIRKIGWGFVEKVFATLNKRFWDPSDFWVNTVTKCYSKNKYPAIFVVPNSGNKNAIEIFVSGSHAVEISTWSN